MHVRVHVHMQEDCLRGLIRFLAATHGSYIAQVSAEASYHMKLQPVQHEPAPTCS